MLFRRLLTSSALVAFALPATAQHVPGQAQPAPSGPYVRLPDVDRLSQPKDPTTDQQYGCYFWGYYIWNGVEGRLYWPNDCDGSQRPPAGVELPLVILMHGDGHSFTDYTYLVRHLALNGFIVATIESVGTNLERSDDALTYMGFIRNNWVYRTSVSDTTGLIGHSRGGEAVLTLARRIDELALDYDVEAVISLAPTDNDEGGGGFHESLSGAHCDAYLVMYGTHDEDVFGMCTSGGYPFCGQPLTSPQPTGFALYDRAGSEDGTEPFPLLEDVVTKSMLFIEGANHNSWRETCAGFPAPGQLDCDTHQDLAKGYMNAFLRWHLSGKDLYRDFFTAKWTPESVDHVTLHTQYQEGYGRRVVDNFEAGGWGTNTLGGTVFAESTLNVVQEDTTYDYDATIPHDSKSLVVTWSPPGLVPWLRWDIPDGQTFSGRRYRDITPYTHLSLRAGQVWGSAFNTPSESKDFYVQLRDSGGQQSDWVRVSDYTDLSYPTVANVFIFGTWFVDTAASAMQTVRIPLIRFIGIDGENVSSLHFFFSAPGSHTGELVLDNLEFTD